MVPAAPLPDGLALGRRLHDVIGEHFSVELASLNATLNAAGNPVQGSTVLFDVQGSVTTSGSCTTDANGQCSFTYQGPQLPGADVITGCADSGIPSSETLPATVFASVA